MGRQAKKEAYGDKAAGYKDGGAVKAPKPMKQAPMQKKGCK